MYWNPVARNDVIWNFEKFLVDRDGMAYKRYNPDYPIHDMIDDINDVLEKEYLSTHNVQQEGQEYVKNNVPNPLPKSEKNLSKNQKAIKSIIQTINKLETRYKKPDTTNNK